MRAFLFAAFAALTFTLGCGSPERIQFRPAERRAIFERDGCRCQYCAGIFAPAALEVDHEMPVVQGGTNDPANLSTACRPCNRRKGGRTVEEFEAWSERRGANLSIGQVARVH